MTDILALIERLRRWFAYENCGPVGPMRDDLKEAAEALSRTVSPLPEEIADHLHFLRTYSTHPGITDAAAALELLARENERLRQGAPLTAKQRERMDAMIAEREAKWEALRVRIRDLEAERDRLKDDLAFADERNRQLLAVKAKTIEECAKIADRSIDSVTAATAIRALATSD